MRSPIAKYRSMAVPAKAALWFTACGILQKGVAFFTVPLFTRLMSPAQYGLYSLYLSWLQILTILTSLYLYYGVFYNAMAKFEDDRDRYISSMQGLTLLLTAAVFGVYLAGRRMWNGLLGLSTLMMAMMFVEMALTPAMNFWAGRQRFEYRYRRLVAVTLAKSLLNPAAGLAAVMLSDDKATARVVSVAAVEFIFCGTLTAVQFARGRRLVSRRYWAYALALALPLIPHYLAGMVLNQGDRIMIGRMAGQREVAFYSVAYNIGMTVQIFTGAVNNSFTPWLYRKLKSGDCGGVARTVNLMLLLIAGIILALMLCSPELVRIFGSADYRAAAAVVPPVAASVFFIFLYSVLATPQFYFEKTGFLLVSSVGAAALNVALNLVFIKRFGYVAAGYTTLACYVLYSAGHYFVSRRVVRRRLPSAVLFSPGPILLVGSAVVLAGTCCSLLFRRPLLRYGLLLALLIAAAVLLKNVKKINFPSKS